MKKHLKIGLVMVLAFLMAGKACYGTSVGPNASATAIIGTCGTNTATWSNPSNATGAWANLTYATSTFTGGAGSVSTYCIDLSAFSFSIPTGATINGYFYEMQIYGSTAVTETAYYLGDTPYFLNCTSGGGKLPVALPTAPTAISFGSSSDLWGSTCTVAQINSSSFGVRHVFDTTDGTGATINFDSSRLTIYYTAAAKVKHRVISAILFRRAKKEVYSQTSSARIVSTQGAKWRPYVLYVGVSGLLSSRSIGYPMADGDGGRH